MPFDLKAGFHGPGGDVAVRPSKVVLVIRSTTGFELMLESGSYVTLHQDAEDVATSLWGFTTASDNGFFNPDHVLAVTPLDTGSRILLTNNIRLDTTLPIGLLIKSLSRIDDIRKDLGVHLTGRMP